MAKIIYKPLFTVGAVALPDLGGVILEPGVPSDELSDQDAAYALGNPNFVDAATGENPYYEISADGVVLPRAGAQARPTGVPDDVNVS